MLSAWRCYSLNKGVNMTQSENINIKVESKSDRLSRMAQEYRNALNEFHNRDDIFEISYCANDIVEKNFLGYYLKMASSYPVLSCENEKQFLVCYKSDSLKQITDDLEHYSKIITNVRKCSKDDYDAEEIHAYFDRIKKIKSQVVNALSFH